VLCGSRAAPLEKRASGAVYSARFFRATRVGNLLSHL
jgi:hypothetical protein